MNTDCLIRAKTGLYRQFKGRTENELGNFKNETIIMYMQLIVTTLNSITHAK